jgi:hypothetical protein
MRALGLGLGWNLHGERAVAPPTNSVAPAITGIQLEGSTLTSSTGTWSGSPTFTYQWNNAGVAIDGATASTHVLVEADNDAAITCTVTAHNGGGSLAVTTAAVTPWTPNSIAGLAGRWDSLHVNKLDGNPAGNGNLIKRFKDVSPNGKNIDYAGTATVSPILRTAKTDTNFGPKDAVQYAGTEALVVPASIVLTQPFTIWHVARNDVGDKVVMGGTGGAWASYTASGSGQAAYQAGLFRGSTVVNLGLWSITIMRFASVAGTSKLRVDGTTAATDDPGTNAGTGVGIGDYASGGNQMTGFFAEAGVSIGAMSDADIAKLEHYLSLKWGVDAL